MRSAISRQSGVSGRNGPRCERLCRSAPRSQRALLTHWAPASGPTVTPLDRPRMLLSCRWEPSVRDAVHPPPVGPVPLPAASQRPVPVPNHLRAKLRHHPHVGRDRVIREVPAYHPGQPRALFRDGIMSASRHRRFGLSARDALESGAVRVLTGQRQRSQDRNGAARSTRRSSRAAETAPPISPRSRTSSAHGRTTSPTTSRTSIHPSGTPADFPDAGGRHTLSRRRLGFSIRAPKPLPGEALRILVIRVLGLNLTISPLHDDLT